MSHSRAYLAVTTVCLFSLFFGWSAIGVPWLLVHRTEVTEQGISIGRLWSPATLAKYEYAAQSGDEEVTISRFVPFFNRYVRVNFNRRCDCVTDLFFMDSDDSWVSMSFQTGIPDGGVLVSSGLDIFSPLHNTVSMTRSKALEQMRKQVEEAVSVRQYLKGLVKT